MPEDADLSMGEARSSRSLSLLPLKGFVLGELATEFPVYLCDGRCIAYARLERRRLRYSREG